VFSFRSLLVPAALATALAVPAIGFAQAQPSAAQLQQPAQGQRHQGGFGFMREMRSLNLSTQQQSQIKQLMQQYRQAHPRGSARDPQARKDLRTKIMAVLTPAQQAQLKSERQQRESQSGRGHDRVPEPSPSPAI